ncbi:MAG: hypothetical protein OXG24_02605 [Gammaproteobacteria bacterium]|nr:hypothetical protein [Gammaproteobacteria bacterium]
MSTSSTDIQPVQPEELDGLTGSTFFLGEECPERLDQDTHLKSECLDAVEQHFSKETTYTVDHFGMIPMESSFTYGAMTGNYERDRERVIEAFLSAECRLVEGPIRMDLKEKCNSYSFFRFAYFSEMCDGPIDSSIWVVGNLDQGQTLS